MVAMTHYQTSKSGSYQTAKSPALLIDQNNQVDLNSFNELVLAYQDDVYRQALWILGDEESAEDATQEAFLRAYRNLTSFNGGPFRPWILRITTNYCLDQLRRRKIRKTIPLEAMDENDEEIETTTWLKDPGSSVEEILVRADEEAYIRQSIDHLPTDYRIAIVLVDLQGLDYREASSSLGIPLGTFKSRLSRARLQLQKHLNPDRISSLAV